MGPGSIPSQVTMLQQAVKLVQKQTNKQKGKENGLQKKNWLYIAEVTMTLRKLIQNDQTNEY